MTGSGALETVQETLARLRWRKTQPHKSPLSGGLVAQFPPDKGGKGRGGRNDKYWIFAQSLKPHFRLLCKALIMLIQDSLVWLSGGMQTV